MTQNRSTTAAELALWRALRNWLRHPPRCGAGNATDPLDPGCLCGLRQRFMPIHALDLAEQTRAKATEP